MATKKYKNRRKRVTMMMLSCCVLIICGVIWYNSFKLHQKLEVQEAVVESLQEEVEQQKEAREALEEKEAYMTSDEYYKEVAREKLGLADENDIIFKKENP